MKRFPSTIILCLSLYFCVFSQNTAPFNSLFTPFLNQNIKSGLVNYNAIHKNPIMLDSLVALVEKIKWDSLQGSEQKAYLINVYNLFVIKGIVDLYPIHSPMSKPDFFERKIHNLSGVLVSLNQLENEIIQKKYKDPRMHFAMVCGAMGCPKISDEPYLSSTLNQQLDKQTTLALNNEAFIQIREENHTVFVSEIFRWYQNDFTQNHETVMAYINEYRKKKIPNDYVKKYYPYDWTLNQYNEEIIEKEKQKNSLQNYTPSVLLYKDQTEIKWFNNLYTQTSGFDKNKKRTSYNNRSNYYTGILQVLYGAGIGFNMGFDVWFKSVLIQPETGKSPLETLLFKSDSNARSAISGFGPKVKIAPFKKAKGFSIQSTLLLPFASDLDGSTSGDPYLSGDDLLWITELFYDRAIGSDLQLFLRLSPWLKIPRPNPENKLRKAGMDMPLSAFISYFPSAKLTLYLQSEFWPSLDFQSYFLQSGMGLKYQIIPSKLEVEVLYTHFWLGKNTGAGQTFNMGLRLIN